MFKWSSNYFSADNTYIDIFGNQQSGPKTLTPFILNVDACWSVPCIHDSSITVLVFENVFSDLMDGTDDVFAGQVSNQGGRGSTFTHTDNLFDKKSTHNEKRQSHFLIVLHCSIRNIFAPRLMKLFPVDD
jgi:hypothetical protein